MADKDFELQNKRAYLVSNDKEQRLGRMNGSYSWHFLYVLHKRVIGKLYKGWSAQNNLKSKVLFVSLESEQHKRLSHSYTAMKFMSLTWHLSLKGQKSFTV